jgi:short-subunit dehydrogenase
MTNILIVGATSAIAAACARQWSGQGVRFFLAARDGDKLAATEKDLAARGATIAGTCTFDATVTDSVATVVPACLSALGTVDIALIAHGTLPDQAACERDATLAVREVTANALSVVALLTELAQAMENQRRGVIAVISSVAGDRGRPTNYVYGAAKSAVTAFCEGLRARLFAAGVHVLTIKPGFVETPMTAGLALPGPLVASAEKVASDICRAVRRRKDVLYTPWFWRPIMTIIVLLPRFVFKRIRL